MIDITHKNNTQRNAIAGGWLDCQPETLECVHNQNLPKGNLFDIARSSALLAAKQTALLIPHCHPVSLDGTVVEFYYTIGKQVFHYNDKGHGPLMLQPGEFPDTDHQSSGIFVQVSVDSVDRTGPEMEALTATSIALLTIYDLLKPIDKFIEINAVRLLSKKGGKSDQKFRIKEGIVLAIFYLEKESGDIPQAVKLVEARVRQANVFIERIAALQVDPLWLKDQLNNLQAKIVLTVGGTSARNGSPVSELVQNIAPDELPGISEAMRRHGSDRTPLAMYSRSYAAQLDERLLVCLPGSSEGALQSLDALLPGLWQAPRMLARSIAWSQGQEIQT